MLRSLFAWTKKYERHLSLLAMVAGFAADNFFFERVDLLQTQILLAGYAIACFVSIPALHYLETRATKRGTEASSRARVTFHLIIQFALGGFWSAFVIFYGRAAVFGASWPFLLFVFLVFLGSEYFHKYHARLVFTSVLFFFALYAWAIFEVPLFTSSIGVSTFLLSGAVAIGVFALFTMVLRLVAPGRFREEVWRIRAGAGVVLLAMNLFYFTDVLPPLPLSATAAGVYHSVWHIPGNYLAKIETSQSWTVQYLGLAPTLHITLGETIYAYTAIYAPTDLSTTITHQWEWYDPVAKAWVTRAAVSYPIQGGRENGYRGYTNMPIRDAGQWRVNIRTADGRLLNQLPFTVVSVSAPVSQETVTLK